ncbi:ragulator complex protein LAMTOR4 homolog [Neodiprion pinetum]|uniref:Late endosomal/lysosomal adaptor and MAPK and MTOR activator 4 n=1 Tax=Neodiprion lecontei TaxID=441921 RepID=A0A6J0BYX2_NEOLC|nr:ragulator complex protein LAMTOR4 homolog [Neodiprion lecontei]XP_046482995.1 ragulator complex protein LAMTOR4 homolog [Neodiprion pinetum]XP_046623222.1 ragulator complex protein LAMTOR4 homolog [Neodiprion virginianus]
MLSMERIPEQIGYLVLKEDGAVLTSGGELENDERIANIIMSLITLTDTIDPKAFASDETFNKISITYEDHCYVICLSNKKVHIVKKKITALTSSQEQQQQHLPVIA